MSAPITEAHRKAAVAIFAIAMKSAHHGAAFREPCAQLIADSEARAVEAADFALQQERNIHMTTIAERDQLRAEVERLKRDYEYDHKCLHEVRDRCELWKQRAERAEAELATERARRDDLVADINDACITLASAKDDCDDYAMQNTGFKLEAVRDVLLQYIPNAAMKEGAT
jgi:hypothetical protein